MRVVITGATGNHGTAVLKALHSTPEITHITGIARRLPDTESDPYAGCRWETVDIAAASTATDAITELTDIFRGADAVIHLAWLIQPNERRELLHRVNVEGTRRVTEAIAAAGVPHLVVASSVGAYSPDPTRETDGTLPLRDENWPATGITSSHYSSDKADQERVLNDFSVLHPDVVITRLRPGLTFQADAAAEIQRYFIGSTIPDQALKMTPPVLPLPKGLAAQAVHADDLGKAYALAVVKKAGGAFNVCAPDILYPQDFADIIDHGHFIEVPPTVARATVAAAHKAGTLAADAGWIDMAMQVPMMDNSRAVKELGWRPQHSAADALRELLGALRSGQGTSSLPLRPRDRDPAVPSGEIPEEMSRELLQLYLSDHLTGATAGVERMNRMAQDYVDTPMFATLSALAVEIRTEQVFLKNLIQQLGLKQMHYRQAMADVAEKVGRLKGNGRAVSRSPMTMLLETELMRSAVIGKKGGWQTLIEHAGKMKMDPAPFTELRDKVPGQLAALDEVHAYARSRALMETRKTYEDQTDAPQE